MHDMFNGGGAVLFCSHATDQSQITFSVKLRGCGSMLMYASRQPEAVVVDGGLELMSSYEEASGKLTVDVPASAKDLHCELQVSFGLQLM